MRIFSVIAGFALATVVCAEVIPLNSGISEAISFQTRSLRGEGNRISRRKPFDVINNGVNDGTSAEAPAGAVGPSRSRRSYEEAARTKNGGGATSTPAQPRIGTRSDYYPKNLPAHSLPSSGNIETSSMRSKKSTTRNQPSMESLPTFQKQNGQFDVNHFYTQRRNPANVPVSFFDLGPSGMTSTTRNQRNMGSLSKFQRQNGQFDLKHYYTQRRNPANVPLSFFDLGTSGMTSTTRNQQNMRAFSRFRRDISPLVLNQPAHSLPSSESVGKNSNTRNQQSMGSLSEFQKQNAQYDINLGKGKKPANVPISFFDLGTSRTISKKSSNHHSNPGNHPAPLLSSSRSVGTSGMTSKKSNTRNQQSMGSLSEFQKQNAQFDVNLGKGKNPTNVPISFFDLGTSRTISKKSSMSTDQTSVSTSRSSFDSHDSIQS